MSDKHNGFIGSNGEYYLLNCGVCKKENYTSAVSTGICAWCWADGRTPSQKAKQELAASLSQNDHEQ